MKSTIEAMKQALAAGEKFITKVHTGRAKSIETYDDLTASNISLREAIAREEAQSVEPVTFRKISVTGTKADLLERLGDGGGLSEDNTLEDIKSEIKLINSFGAALHQHKNKSN